MPQQRRPYSSIPIPHSVVSAGAKQTGDGRATGGRSAFVFTRRRDDAERESQKSPGDSESCDKFLLQKSRLRASYREGEWNFFPSHRLIFILILRREFTLPGRKQQERAHQSETTTSPPFFFFFRAMLIKPCPLQYRATCSVTATAEAAISYDTIPPKSKTLMENHLMDLKPLRGRRVHTAQSCSH